ncbi:yeats-domain-containing protein, partial [Meredithblackwellia eburnea MCA 4105]
LEGVSVFRPIIYGNSTVLLEPHEKGDTDHTHRWTVGVRTDQIGGADDISYFIKKVTFKLHDSFPQPLRTLEKAPFEVTETGWGEFDIVIKIFFVPEAAEKPISFSHHLKLHPWPLPTPAPAKLIKTDEDGASPPIPAAPEDEPVQPIISPVHSWQYEEIVFSEPTETFYAVLLSKAPTPLPRSNRLVIKDKTLQMGMSGNIGEFSVDMEAEEGDRLDLAKKNALEEIESLRKKLISNEKELAGQSLSLVSLGPSYGSSYFSTSGLPSCRTSLF